MQIRHLPLLSSINLPLVELIHILTVFCHQPISFLLFAHSLVGSPEYVQVDLNYILNQFV